MALRRYLEGGFMAATLDLSPDELLTTTRAVRRRLDFTREVPRELIEECLEIALQAPSASNHQGWHFVVVTDPEVRRRIADEYRKAWEIYLTLPISAGNLPVTGEARKGEQKRVVDSAQYMADHFEEAPVFLIPCIDATFGGEDNVMSCTRYGSVIQAAWSFQLAARARGLGSCWTTLHLIFAKEVAEILDLPDSIEQVALIPVGYSKGTDFKPAPREPLAEKLHYNAW
jgi:nitroreductase